MRTATPSALTFSSCDRATISAAVSMPGDRRHLDFASPAPASTPRPSRSRSAASCPCGCSPECPADPFRYPCGRITSRIPWRCAASSFSFKPPMGSTRPRTVISPVMAISARTGMLVSALHDAGGDGDSGRGAVFRNRAFRNVQVNVEVPVEIARQSHHVARGCARNSSPPAPIPASRRPACRWSSACRGLP